MTFRYVTTNLLDVDSLDSVSTESTIYTMDFLYNRRPSKPFRFTAKVAQEIKIDFGVNTRLTHVSIFNHNIVDGREIRLQADDADVWAPPPLNQLLTWRDYALYYHFNKGYQLWKLYVSVNAGDPYPQIGELVLGRHAKFENAWIQPDWGQGLNFSIAEARTYFGQEWDYYLSQSQSFRLKIRNLNDPSTIDDLQQFFTDIQGSAGRFVLIPNDTLPFCFYVKVNMLDIDYEQIVRGHRDLNEWSLNIKTLSQGITLL